MNAERIEVKGNAMLDTGFRAKGQVNLYDARIHGGFKWTWDSSPEEVMLDLQSARIGNLYDKAESWPAKGRLLLNGLVYDEIHEDAPTDAKTRIEWLKRQPADRFRPQPYEQLAAVFRKAGQEADAIKVLVAKGHRRFWAKERWAGPRAIFQQLWHGFLGLTIAYGYRPWRAFWFGVVVVLLGVHLFAAGYEAGMMKPTEKTAAVSGSPNGGLAAEKDSFNAVVYSIDTFLPVVNLYQADFWLPDPNQPGEAQMLRKPNVRFTAGQLRTYLWIHIALGWILTTLLVVGLTGLVRR